MQYTHKSGQSLLPSSSFEHEPNRSLNFRSQGTVLSINLTQHTKIFEMQGYPIRAIPLCHFRQICSFFLKRITFKKLS